MSAQLGVQPPPVRDLDAVIQEYYPDAPLAIDVVALLADPHYDGLWAGAMLAGARAVRELIQADAEYDAAVQEMKDLNRKVAEQGWLEVEFDALRKSCVRVVRAQERRRIALANVGPQ